MSEIWTRRNRKESNYNGVVPSDIKMYNEENETVRDMRNSDGIQSENIFM